jgi:C7-C12 aromatase (ARO/CYC)
MPETQTQDVTLQVTVPAPPEAVYTVVSDLSSWPQYHPSAVHAEICERDSTGVLVQHWAVTGPSSVRTWRARWEFDPGRHLIRFVHERPPAPLTALEGAWILEPEDGGCRVLLRHTLTYAPADHDAAQAITATLTRNARELLETARDTVTRREQLRSLVLSFEDTVFIAGAAKDVYAFLYDAAAWPDRLPHVARLDLEEPVPGVQFFDMETKAPDGSLHTTRSVRICLPDRLIVYKQTKLPALLDAHTGHWSLVETPEGVLASARHTVTIKPSALGLLGDTATVPQARRYLRRSLSVHSVRNLTLAKDYAEGLAGV